MSRSSVVQHDLAFGTEIKGYISGFFRREANLGRTTISRAKVLPVLISLNIVFTREGHAGQEKKSGISYRLQSYITDQLSFFRMQPLRPIGATEWTQEALPSDCNHRETF